CDEGGGEVGTIGSLGGARLAGSLHAGEPATSRAALLTGRAGGHELELVGLRVDERAVVEAATAVGERRVDARGHAVGGQPEQEPDAVALAAALGLVGEVLQE